MVGPGALVWTEGERMGGSSSWPRESIWSGWPMRALNRGLSAACRDRFSNQKWDQPPLGNRHHCCISAINNVLTAHCEDDFWREFLMFFWRWYAGASIEFETNKGRVISFHPYLATRFKRMSNFILCLNMAILRQKDKEVTIRASPGQEIIMLKIKYYLKEAFNAEDQIHL